MNIKISFPILVLFIFVLFITLINGCTSDFPCDIIDCKIKSGKDITFFIATDPHHLSKNLYNKGKAFDWFLNSGDGKLLEYTDEIIDAYTLDIKVRQPDILIIPGDLTCNGEKESHFEMIEKLKTIEALGIPVFVIPGNHDINNPWARNYVNDEMIKIDSITEEEFLKLYKSFGYKEAIFTDDDSLSYLAAPAEDVWLLMLDSAKYKHNNMRTSPEMGSSISSKTLKWIKKCSNLAKENNAEIIAIMHHSLMNHSNIVNEDFTIDNSQEVIDTFLKCNIQIVLSGHIHLQDIKCHSNNNKTIYDIATSCLIAYPNQYGILEFSPDKGYNYYTNRVNMDRWVEKNNISDKNMLNFKNYTRNFFETRSYDKYYESLLEISKFTDEEMKAISRTIATLNLKYFAGFRNQFMHSIFNTKGFQILQDTAPCSVRNYIMSMFNDQFTDNNKIFIPIQRK
ncbi:metallophosphoesterase [Schnuerera sp. xch1]|uniref:metallophosphoesterase n=1 Tax=Schnuerera sp. xch1 TaxID=2874283 RepID=UPI001CBD5378|nr:metallophosphoesterase [Schnuerera sp. xch1]MBZ2174702.1 metallophosphoesterase [Schnuerera sp. xch1]